MKPGLDDGVEMLGLLLIYAAVVIAIATIVIWLW